MWRAAVDCSKHSPWMTWMHQLCSLEDNYEAQGRPKCGVSDTSTWFFWVTGHPASPLSATRTTFNSMPYFCAYDKHFMKETYLGDLQLQRHYRAQPYSWEWSYIREYATLTFAKRSKRLDLLSAFRFRVRQWLELERSHLAEWQMWGSLCSLCLLADLDLLLPLWHTFKQWIAAAFGIYRGCLLADDCSVSSCTYCYSWALSLLLNKEWNEWIMNERMNE